MTFHWPPQIGTRIKIHQQRLRTRKIAKFIQYFKYSAYHSAGASKITVTPNASII